MSVTPSSTDPFSIFFFFFNDTATTEIYTLSLHDALPICAAQPPAAARCWHPSAAGARPCPAMHCRPAQSRHRNNLKRQSGPKSSRSKRKSLWKSIWKRPPKSQRKNPANPPQRPAHDGIVPHSLACGIAVAGHRAATAGLFRGNRAQHRLDQYRADGACPRWPQRTRAAGDRSADRRPGPAGPPVDRRRGPEGQPAARGGLARRWTSGVGDSLPFSLGMPLAPADWSGLSLAVGLSVAQSLQPQLPAPGSQRPRIGLKWPNDLWIDGDRKLGGILIETASFVGSAAHEPGTPRYVVVGIGLNVRPRPGDGMRTPPARDR